MLTMFQDVRELALGDSIAIEDDPLGVGRLSLDASAVALVHLDHAGRHVLQVVDHLLARRLHAAVRDVLSRVGIDVSNKCREGRAAVRTRGGMDDIRTKTISVRYWSARRFGVLTP